MLLGEEKGVERVLSSSLLKIMKAVNPQVDFGKLDRDILAKWKKEDTFLLSSEPDAPLFPGGEKRERDSYVFYDGPPFATGLPHYGHLLAGTIKDVIGRFFTMKGMHVARRFGWDCHGVPVEFEIQKEFDLHGQKAILAYGIERFNEECRKIVLRYSEQWREFVERSGRWVDFTKEYRTMDLSYMESIWWVVKELWDKDFIYQSFKSVPYSWAINTPLSNFEANLNYKTVQDPALTVRFRADAEAEKRLAIELEPDWSICFYAWTTTPWTLPSNMGLAVGAEVEYVLLRNEVSKEYVVVASASVEKYFPQLQESDSVLVEKTFQGSLLGGLSYQPIFSYFSDKKQEGAFVVHLAEFVTADDGTGIVHLASYGEDDLALFLARSVPFVDPVDADGNFTDEVSDFSGLNVKEADSQIAKKLKDEGRLVLHETIEHSYPFCWRTDTPLIYKPINSWFVRVEQIKEKLTQKNSQINWVPEHVGEGRMSHWLSNARDWAISRNRFWGTPLPIWCCESCQSVKCIGSASELEEFTGKRTQDLHRHFIDHLEGSCVECGGVMGRVSEVLDCWFESGSMPYAQVHYPFSEKDKFKQRFPADFIAEGLDQTRGWFYTLLVLGTALFDEVSYKNVVVNGILLAEDGKKMSKSLKNYPPPGEVLEEFGADALRLYMLSSAASRAEELRFNKAGVKDVVRQHLLPLWNAYNFLVTYAEVDGWRPGVDKASESENVLDRWILSKVLTLSKDVDEALSSYKLYNAAQPILDFIDQLTNWYIRLNRRRFWSVDRNEHCSDKNLAYATLHKAILSFVRVLAPLAPFVSEEIFSNLKTGVAELDCDSVHFTSFPDESEGFFVEEELEQSMAIFEELILLARSVRNQIGIKVRQPLAKISVIYPDRESLDGLSKLEDYIKDELNVKLVEYLVDEEKFVELSAQLNTQKLGRVLGPVLGSSGMKQLRQEVGVLSTEQIRSVEAGATVSCAQRELGVDDIVIRRRLKKGIDAAGSSGRITVQYDTELSQALKREGLSREFVNRVQRLRKSLDFQVSDRIQLEYKSESDELLSALSDYRDYIMSEILALQFTPVDRIGNSSEDGLNGGSEELEIEGVSVTISLCRNEVRENRND